MIKGKFGQARCQACQSWHWAVQLDDNLNPTEFKCCRCGRLIEYSPKVRIKGVADVSENKDNLSRERK